MVAYESLKTKEKSSWVIPKVVVFVNESDRLWELKFKPQFKRGFTKVVAVIDPGEGPGGPRPPLYS